MPKSTTATVNMGPVPMSQRWMVVANVLAITSEMNERDFKFKQQQLNGKDNRRDRRAKGSRHPRRSATCQ